MAGYGRFLLLLWIASRASAQTTLPLQPATRPIPQVERVMVISIDGLRPDLILRAKTPTLHKLFEGGSFTFYAQTIPIAITLPSHTSMLTGVSMEKHGVTWNDERYVKNPVYTKATTLFELAHSYGMTT